MISWHDEGQPLFAEMAVMKVTTGREKDCGSWHGWGGGMQKADGISKVMSVRLAYFVSHPIQYQAPLLQRIAREDDIDLTVFFSSDLSVRGYSDEGFGGVQVKWDVPLLEGYRHEFLPGIRKSGGVGVTRPISRGILSRLRKGKFDAVWVHGYHTVDSMHAILAARLLGLPVLLRAESSLDDRPRGGVKLAAKKVFFRGLGPLVSCVLPIGSKNEAYWRTYLGGRTPMFRMPYSVDNEYFQQKAAEAAAGREELRRSLGLEPGRPVILFASKLQTRKRCMDLVEAFLRLRGGAADKPAAYLVIVGDGEERGALERRIAASGSEHVRMLGFRNQSELPRFFDLCDVFVLPSIHEPWGLIVNELMSAGRAVVVTDQVGSAPDMVENGGNGFVFPAGDVSALSAVLQRFVDEPELAARLGEKARERVADFSFERDVDGLRRALQMVVPGFSA